MAIAASWLAEEDLEICAEASSAEEALPLLDRCPPDLVLCDIALGGRNGLELLKGSMVSKGDVYVSQQLASQIVAAFSGRSAGSSGPVFVLADRELEVFQYIGKGLVIKEIAELMNLSPRTIESYRARLKEKMCYPDGRTLVHETIR